MQYLVLTQNTRDFNWIDHQEILADEAKVIWQSFRAGNLRNIWLTENKNDAVLIFESDSEAFVKSILDSLPLVQEGMISYQVIGLTPYKGFERLFGN